MATGRLGMEDREMLTRKQMRIEHRRLWKWLAMNPKRGKIRWPGWKRLGVTAPAYCFACLASSENCEKCPIEWSGGPCAMSSRSEYVMWTQSTGKRRSALALKIAGMWPEEK